VWDVDTYKITFKLVINHCTNEILQRIVVSSGLSRPGIIDARARYRAAARHLRNTGLVDTSLCLGGICSIRLYSWYFYSEDGGSSSCESSVYFCRNTWPHFPEDRTEKKGTREAL